MVLLVEFVQEYKGTISILKKNEVVKRCVKVVDIGLDEENGKNELDVLVPSNGAAKYIVKLAFKK